MSTPAHTISLLNEYSLIQYQYQYAILLIYTHLISVYTRNTSRKNPCEIYIHAFYLIIMF